MQTKIIRHVYNLVRHHWFSLALILWLSTSHPGLAVSTGEAGAKALFAKAICQLNDINGNPDRLNIYFNRIVMLTKSDIVMREQILTDSISEVKKFIRNKEYSKAEVLLPLSLRLDPNGDNNAIRTLIVLKAKLDRFDDIEPTLSEYFRLVSPKEPSRWDLNLVKAKLLTYAGNTCEKYSKFDQAEHFYRMAIRQTTEPISTLGLVEWDNMANKCYYWSQIYAQVRLGQLLINAGKENAGTAILSTIKNSLGHNGALVPGTNAESKLYCDNFFDRIFELESEFWWKRDCHNTYIALKMPEPKNLFNDD